MALFDMSDFDLAIRFLDDAKLLSEPLYTAANAGVLSWAVLPSNWTRAIQSNIAITPKDQDVIHRSVPGVDSDHSHR